MFACLLLNQNNDYNEDEKVVVLSLSLSLCFTPATHNQISKMMNTHIYEFRQERMYYI